MKKIILATFLFLVQIPSAHAYLIDGSLSDWGVTLNAASQTKPYLDTHLPSGGNDIDAATEDNADHNDGFVFVGPGYSIGNRYDAEAFYLDNDANYLYYAIVTGLPQNELAFPAGDVFFDNGFYQDPLSPNYNAQKYGFGIDITNGKLYAANSWQNVIYPQHAASNPWKMGDDKTFLADTSLVYSGEQNTHYVIEGKAPLDVLGLSFNGNQAELYSHWTMQCGNDQINLHGDVNVVPEPATLSLMSLGLFGVFRRRLRLG